MKPSILTESEFLSAVSLRDPHHDLRRGIIVVGPVFWLVGFWAGGTEYTALFTVTGLVVFVSLLFYFFIMPAKRKRIFAQSAFLRDAVTFSWDGEGLGLQTVRGSMKVPWTYFRGWYEDTELFVLLLNDIQIHIVAKRCFESIAEMESFRSTMTQAFMTLHGKPNPLL